MPAKPDDQLRLDEKSIEDPELERLLDVRTAARDRLATVQADVKRATTAALAAIEKLDLGVDSAVRVGRYRVTKTMRKADHREFDIEAAEHVSISLVKE